MANPPSSYETVSPIQFQFECPRCGHGVASAEAKRCAACGQRLGDAEDGRSALLTALGFLLPPVGLGLFLLLRSKLPRKAACAAQGAIWSPLLYLLIVPYLASVGVFTPLVQALTR